MYALGVTSFKDLVAGLLMWLGAHTAYPVPDQLPDVQFLPTEQLQEMVCGDDNCQVLAFYHFDKGIFLDDSFADQMGLCEVSIVVHELVHFLQNHARGDQHSHAGMAVADGAVMEKWVHAEMEAHNIQLKFINQYDRRFRPREINYTYNVYNRTQRRNTQFYARGCQPRSILHQQARAYSAKRLER